ncbi:MAG: prepilin-type N-terminal cleavage/methylation domain-containing protein [Desulfoplanes sp.]|nr:prepilin-type N-terminal cleavage/methylation domain-containing protein [Desulfoplanes sp.]
MQMPTSRKDSGFTLIEMAIVLVIIGLIIGAVLKGQDLIQNARAKKFVNFARAAEIAQWTYLDRKGHFNGDDGSNGLIDNSTNPYVWTGFTNEPDINLVLGSFAYNLYWGNDQNATNPKNVIMISPVTEDAAFSADELVFLESLDTAIDGVSNATGGQIVGVTTYIKSNGNASEALTPITTVEWGTTVKTVLYYFDRHN